MNTANKQMVRHLIPLSSLLLAIYSVVPYMKAGIPMSSLLNNTTLWWGISFLILMVYYLSKSYFFDKRNAKNMWIIWLYLYWNVICIIRGMFIAEIYWDWKALIGNTMALMLPLVIFSATNKVLVQSLFIFYIKYALPLFLVVGVMIRTDAFGFYLIPMTILLFFLPLLTKRVTLYLLVVTFIIFMSDLGARSNVIKFGVPFIILLYYVFRNHITVKMLEISRLVLVIAPIIFFVLGVTGVFNVFKMDEYLKGDYTSMGVNTEGDREEQDLTVDTRTFLYEEVLGSAMDNNYWILGRTPARGNDSESFGIFAVEVTGRYERISNEIGLANVFTWTGIIGVILYFMIFYRASYLAVNKSRNIYIKMLGIFISFRWLYSWIEDINNFSLNYFMLMIVLGLCFSHSFRNMTDNEVKIWVRGIFDVRYVRLQQYLNKKHNNEKKVYSRLANLSQQEK